MDTSTREKVVQKVRAAIVAAAWDADVIRKKTSTLAKRAEMKWEASKPLQRKVQGDVRRAAHDVVEFGKSVAQGVKEGVREVRMKSERRES